MTLLLLLATLSAGETDQAFDQFFTDFAQKRDAIEILEARFSQASVSPDETVHTGGHIVYARPKRILFNYEDQETVFLVEGAKVYIYEAKLQQLQIHQLGDDPQTHALFLGFDNDTKALKAAYEIELGESKEESCGTKQLTLRPKRRDAGSDYFEKALLYLRDGDYLPCRVHIVNDAESNTDIRIIEYKLNKEADRSKLRLQVPEGTDIIENDQFVEKVGPGGKTFPSDAPAKPAPDVKPSDSPDKK
ncbi:MAG: outer membrane lipoprotein carrier protein LolA [Candidatus Hydrogenedentes bacterium]|nr:outer membrane lipoprotein carrier protein LolA [Candidatus Hydrogenedentota bacterium]